MKDKDGVEIVEKGDGISQEDLIAKTVAGVLDGLKDNKPEPVPAEIDPFDFSELDQTNNPGAVDPVVDPVIAPVVVNPAIVDPNVDPVVDPAIYNPINQQIQDPRFDNLSANMETNAKNIEANSRITKMNNFIMEFNSEVKAAPELDLETFRDRAVDEAKKSIASGQYIPASDMLSYLHGKDSIGKSKNVETNPNPSIGDGNQLNPNADEKPFDPWAEDVTADDIKEKYKDVQF